MREGSALPVAGPWWFDSEDSTVGQVSADADRDWLREIAKVGPAGGYYEQEPMWQATGRLIAAAPEMAQLLQRLAVAPWGYDQHGNFAQQAKAILDQLAPSGDPR